MSGPFSDRAISTPKINAAAAGDNPLTVLQLVDADHLGGAERSALAVARAVVAAGGRALIGAGGAQAGRVRAAGAETFTFRAEASTLRRSRSAASLVAIVRDAGVDIIHARSAATAAIGRMAAETLGARFVTTLHAAPETGWRRGPGDRALVEADRVIAVSAALADAAGASGATVIPRGAAMDVFAEEVVSAERTIRLAEDWGLAEDTRPIILAPGRLVADNGPRVLIDAVDALRVRRGADFLCLFVGDGDAGYISALEEQAVRQGLAGMIRFVGSTEDMPAALKLSAVVASAATTPPAAARALIEAQAMGRPVIAPAHGAAAEFVADGETGWLTTPGDAVTLAEAMDAALSMDESQRAHIGMAGRARVRARYTLDAMLSAVLGVYEDVAGRGFGPPYE